MSDLPRKTFETFWLRIINQTLTVLAGVIVARGLGPFGKGIFTYVTTVSSVLYTLSNGQSSAVSRQYGRLKRPSADVYRAMTMIQAVGVSVIVIAIVIVAIVSPRQRPLLAVAAALPFTFFAQNSLGFFLADGKVRVVNAQVILSSTWFLLVVIPILWVFHLGLIGVLAAWVSAAIVAAIYSAIRATPYRVGPHATFPSFLREQALFGIRVSANALVMLLNFRIDVFLILYLLGAKALGIYSIAIGIGETMWQLSRPLGVTAFRYINSGTRVQATYMTTRCVRHAFTMVAAACVLLFLFAPPLITLVYGHAFSGAGAALRVLLPGIVAYSVVPFFNGFFTQQLGKVNVPLVISSVSAVLCAAITFATVRHWGIVGGAFATSATYVGALAANVILFRKETSVPIKSLFVFGLDDVRPYTTLASSIWNRALAFAAGKRN